MGYKFFRTNVKNKRDIYFAILAGALLGVSYPPFRMYLLAFVAFLPYFFVVSRRTSIASINRITYVFAFFFNLVTLYWVGSWTKEADPFLMLSGGVLLFFNPLVFLFPSTLYAIVKRRAGEKTALLFFPFFWVSYEFLYSVTEFRFPWLTLGNSQAYFTTFIQFADLLGVYGISLAVLYVNVFLFLFWDGLGAGRKHRFQKVYLYVALILFAIPLLYGNGISPEEFKGDKIKVGIIQPNLNPWKKWDAGSLDEQIDLYFALSRKALKKGAQLLIFPETALPVYLTSSRYSAQLKRFYNFVDSARVPVLTGMPDLNIFPKSNAPKDAKSFKNSERKYTTYNAVYLFLPESRKLEKYHKTLLVPFGEKVPYVEYLPFVGDLLKWEVGISNWNVGEGAKVLQAVIEGRKTLLGAAICIESIYPEYIAEFSKLGAEVLIIVTNDSWYGKSSGPYQHEAAALIRATENRRFLVRAANGGISCVINPMGVAVSETELFTRDVLVSEIELINAKTFYSEHSHAVPYASLLVAALAVLYSFVVRHRKK